MNTHSRAKLALIGVGMFLFAHLYHVTVEFFETHTLQSPVIFRSPIKDRFISPVPTEVIVTPLERPKRDITGTPTPTPKKRALKADLVGDVYAADITPSDEEIIAYIRSKDWDDEVAVALAKSENFWNLTRSFDCRRMGGVNKNGTRDHGLWQINSIHINSGAISLEDTLDCFKATDYAYGLWKGRGGNFSAWSAFNNGSYLNHL